MNWKNKNVLITGGAGMIGSHLTEYIKSKNPANVKVIDNLSVGKSEWLDKEVEFLNLDIRDYNSSLIATKKTDIVFHLAALTGGRGFTGLHDRVTLSNLELDTTLYRACAQNNIEKLIYSSSACVYPVEIQYNTNINLKLTEDLVDYNNIKEADGGYGKYKLISETLLNYYTKDKVFNAVACRQFTVIGTRLNLTHFIAAAMAKTLLRQNPLKIWGDGKQLRNWTDVRDLVRGLCLAAENIESGAINLGTEEVNTPNTAYQLLWEIAGWQPNDIVYEMDKPIGVLNRIADGTKAREILGWKPQYKLKDSLEYIWQWFQSYYNKDMLSDQFERSLTENRI